MLISTYMLSSVPFKLSTSNLKHSEPQEEPRNATRALAWSGKLHVWRRTV